MKYKAVKNKKSDHPVEGLSNDNRLLIYDNVFCVTFEHPLSESTNLGFTVRILAPSIEMATKTAREVMNLAMDYTKTSNRILEVSLTTLKGPFLLTSAALLSNMSPRLAEDTLSALNYSSKEY